MLFRFSQRISQILLLILRNFVVWSLSRRCQPEESQVCFVVTGWDGTIFIQVGSFVLARSDWVIWWQLSSGQKFNKKTGSFVGQRCQLVRSIPWLQIWPLEMIEFWDFIQWRSGYRESHLYVQITLCRQVGLNSVELLITRRLCWVR